MSELLSKTQSIRNCTRNKSRKTLQDLQVSAHDPNQLVPSPMTKNYSKKEVTSALDTTFKVIPAVQEKENVRRSKRKNVVLCGKVSPKEVPKSQKFKKSTKSKRCAAKKEEPNQSTLNAFVSSSSTKQESLDPAEGIEPSSFEIRPSESELNEPVPSSSSNVDLISKEKDSDRANYAGSSGYSVAEQIEWMTSENPPPSYWKVLAEQRRIALDKTLYENALLNDQLEVLQTENSQLKSLLKECETVIKTVQDTL